MCRQAVDIRLKPICRFVDTDGFPVERAHEIPLECGDPNCRAEHSRKPNPWSWSAGHKVPVAKLAPDSPLLTDPNNLETQHLRCNKQVGDRDTGKSDTNCKVSRDWFR